VEYQQVNGCTVEVKCRFCIVSASARRQYPNRLLVMQIEMMLENSHYSRARSALRARVCCRCSSSMRLRRIRSGMLLTSFLSFCTSPNCLTIVGVTFCATRARASTVSAKPSSRRIAGSLPVQTVARKAFATDRFLANASCQISAANQFYSFACASANMTCRFERSTKRLLVSTHPAQTFVTG
jgi:hypothetical protein